MKKNININFNIHYFILPPTNNYPVRYLRSKLSNSNLINIYPERYSFNNVEDHTAHEIAKTINIYSDFKIDHTVRLSRIISIFN